MASHWDGESFKEAFCRLHRCAATEYHQKILLRSVFWYAVPLMLIQPPDSRVMIEARQALDEIGLASSHMDVQRAIDDYHYRVKFFGGFLEKRLRVRLSGRRLLALSRELGIDRRNHDSARQPCGPASASSPPQAVNFPPARLPSC